MTNFFKRVFRPSLVGRLVIAQATTVAILWCLLFAYLWNTSNADKLGLDIKTMNRGTALVLSLASSLRNDPAALKEAMAGIDSLQRELVIPAQADASLRSPIFYLWDQDLLLYQSPNSETIPKPPINNEVRTLSIKGLDWLILTTDSSDSRLRVSVLAPANAETFGVSLFSQGWLVLPLLVSLPLLLIPTWLSVRLALKPWLKLSKEISEREPGNVEPLTFKPRHVELDSLTNAIDSFLSRLRTMRQREKGFIANAAHELRTPIAALGINLALLKKRLTAHTNSDLIEALGSGIERSGRLVSQLLSLARTDSDITVSRKATVNLQQLAQESLAQIMPIADLKNVEIFLEAPHSVWIQGDAESLRTMIENLIENAVKYTTHSSIVSVLVKQIAEQIILQVSDSGPGIAEVDRERVFNRFFRLPNHKEIGSGLGLAIVKAVVDKHDGLIRLNTSSHGGLLVEITFPH